MDFLGLEDSNFVGAPSAPTLNQNFPDVDYPVPHINLHAPPFSPEKSAEQRDRYVTKKHSIP